ncbi:MAG: UDP-glucose 4-epimerase GalE [Verrucomicrobiaceae bacterium]|nr:UDP-glucose 4-epimerase GalE [Verrucomicrobiaceae bacterium]
MRIAVTGGAGYIGSVCVELLCDAGHDVLVIDNLEEGHRDAVDARARLEVVNLAETERVGEVLRSHETDAVIHYAASVLVGESVVDPAKYYRNNVLGGLSLLEAMVVADVRKLVFSSTSATYGIPETVPIDEGCAQDPVNPYGHSKLVFEGMLSWFARAHGITTVVFRYFNAAGASVCFGEDRRVETHLIPNILFVALGKRQSVEVFGTDYETTDGSAVRDYVHVCDLAEAHRRAVEREVSGVFNLGTGRGHSVWEVIEACRAVTGHEIPVVECGRREGDPPVLVATSQKAARVLDWEPVTDLEEMVRSAWAWYQAHPGGYQD